VINSGTGKIDAIFEVRRAPTSGAVTRSGPHPCVASACDLLRIASARRLSALSEPAERMKEHHELHAPPDKQNHRKILATARQLTAQLVLSFARVNIGAKALVFRRNHDNKL
jgi:hypothetical protein